MTRLLIVAALTVSATAYAKERCTPPRDVVLPERGEIDVPLNAKVWAFTPGLIAKKVVASHTVDLSPDSDYVGPETEFHTGTEIDTERPRAPRSIQLGFFPSSNRSDATTGIAIDADYDSDTAWVEVDIADDKGPVAFAALPELTYVCDSGVKLTPGDVRVTVRAIDLAGNASEPVVMTTRVYAAPSPTHRGSDYDASHRRHDDNHGGHIAIWFVAAASSILGRYLRRRDRRRRGAAVPHVEPVPTGEPVSLSVVEAAIKILRLRHAIGTGASCAVMAAGFASGVPWIGLAPGVVALWFMAQLMAEWQGLRNARIDRTIAVRDGRSLILRGPWGRSVLTVSDETFAAAQRDAVPTASVRRDD